MMQSILLTTPTKAPAGEKTGEVKADENSNNVEGKAGEEKNAIDFASVLDDVSSEGEIDAMGEEEINAEELLSEDGTSNSDEEIDNALLSAESDPILEDTLTEEEVDNAENVNIQEEGEAINPILAQIESAKKTDTKVNDNKSSMLVQESGIGTKEAGKEESLKSSSKNTKQKFDSLLSDDLSGKELSNKDSLASTNKLDAIIASLNPETNKTALNQNTGNNMFNAVGGANANVDRPLQQANATNTQTLIQTALQQPIELQSKHGSAAIGERILMMLNQGKQEVTIRLDPAELGSLQIKLHVQQDQVQLAIQTQVGQSRDIIEQNLPRLREQLAQEGINLGEASVEQQSKQNQSNSQDSERLSGAGENRGRGDEPLLDEQSEWISTQIPLSAQGIDYYA